ncbi:MAG TPA: biotin-independent malonate decarboxylase subunit gamma [Actinomycetales bacterium]|nr:biotin-independent malonate decarboxylase subunit gamma [Actinomycetales bacterium]
MEIESLDELDAVLAVGGSLAGARLQGLDLAAREDALLRADVRGAVVLGGTLTDRLAAHLRRDGALLFPTVDGAPVDPYRARLYTPDELYRHLDQGYAATPDWRAYSWWLDPATRTDVFATMLRAVHDDSVSDALGEKLVGRRVIGVMGGHAVSRGTTTYRHAALLGHALAGTGALVLTGGGPGAMEAASLGARLHEQPLDVLDDAVRRLSDVPDFSPDVSAWARLGLEVRESWPAPTRTSAVGVPTWFYGHEPSTPLACCHAKLFSNAVREDLLLAGSTAGLVVLPGAAGTVQEVFQATTHNYYATADHVVPTVLVGVEHWTSALPVWPLLCQLGEARPMGGHVHLVDAIEDAVAVLADAPPRTPGSR